MKKIWQFIFKKRADIKQETVRRTVLSFSVFTCCVLAGCVIMYGISHAPEDRSMKRPLRIVSNVNEKIFSSLSDTGHLVKTYPVSKAVKKVRVNGNIGMSSDFDAAKWKLRVLKSNGDTLFLTLDEIKALPKTEIVFDFKCIEGWSQVTHWAGVRFSDFIHKYDLDTEANMNYTGLITPDKAYYVGIDRESMIHPQTLLCYEMNGKPLPLDQGYPLRLIIPVKYGIKHLKRIGTIYFKNDKPADYWAEQGYDYYSGH